MPADVKDHVVFAVHYKALIFLKPLASDADADDGIPQVCLLTHDRQNGPTSISSNTLYGRASSTAPYRRRCTTLLTDRPRRSLEQHQAGKIAAGPRQLERCRVDTASTFVMPNVNGTVAEENLGGDGYNVQVTRTSRPTALYTVIPQNCWCSCADPGHAIFFNPCEELLDAGEIYVDTYLQCAAVAMHSSEAAFAFANQCLAADRLPKDADDPVLGDGQRYETCRVILVRVPPKLVGQPYSTLVQHAVGPQAAARGAVASPSRGRSACVRAPARPHVVGARDCAPSSW